MYLRPRVMPCLLLRGAGLVKTVQFAEPKYLGDPMNTVRIFNDKEVDELMLLDIEASTSGRGIQFDLVQQIVSEAFVPVAYGGGVTSVDEATRLLALGVEKISLNTAALANPSLITGISEKFGASTVVVSIDARKKRKRYEVMTARGARGTGLDPAEWAQRAEALGAGEIAINSVDRDGTMKGYDLDLIRSVTAAVGVPVIAVGGASGTDDFRRAVVDAHASACAAGALFVFQGKHRAVLISFPGQHELDVAFGVDA